MSSTRTACLAAIALAFALQGSALASGAPRAALEAAVEALPMPTLARRLEAQRQWRDQVASFAQRLGLPLKVEGQVLLARAR